MGFPKRELKQSLPLRQKVDPLAVSMALFEMRDKLPARIGVFLATKRGARRPNVKIGSREFHRAFSDVLRFMSQTIRALPLSSGSKKELIRLQKDWLLAHLLSKHKFAGMWDKKQIESLFSATLHRWDFLLLLNKRLKFFEMEDSLQIAKIFGAADEVISYSKRTRRGTISLNSEFLSSFFSLAENISGIYEGYMFGENESAHQYFESVRKNLIKGIFG